MGKRELLLVLAFLFVGAVVYQATAPDPGPNDRRLSVSRLVDEFRRHVRGNRASIERTVDATHPLDADISELRIVGALAGVEIEGHDRPDLETSLRVVSNAYDDQEAKQFAERTTLTSDRSASAITLSVKYVQGRNTGRQRAFLKVRVPSRTRVRVESRVPMTIRDVAAVEAMNATGDTAIRKITGAVAVTHRGGEAVIEDAASLKLRTRGSETTVGGIRGDASLTIESGGRLRATGIAGGIEVEMRDTDVTLEELERARGMIRVNAVNARLRMRGISTDTRIDGRGTDMEIEVGAPAPVAVYVDGKSLTLTPPASGYRLDALAVEGDIRPDSVIEALRLERTAEPGGKETRVTGGAGPTITVRATRASVTLREPGAAAPASRENESPKPADGDRRRER